MLKPRTLASFDVSYRTITSCPSHTQLNPIPSPGPERHPGPRTQSALPLGSYQLYLFFAHASLPQHDTPVDT